MDSCSVANDRDHVSLETIKSWWKVPAVAHFCSLFRSTFKLPDFEIEELEEALYQDCQTEPNDFLIILLIALLKGSFETEDIDDGNYSDYLRDLCNVHWARENRVNPLNNEDTCFQGLSTLMKVEILYTLCDYRLDPSDVSVLKDYDGATLRVEPLGHDVKGATYWYFYGTRLYREDPPKPPVAKQKKRKKKKKSPSTNSKKQKTNPAAEKQKGRGKKKSTSRRGEGKSQQPNQDAESDSSDSDGDDDDLPLAKISSPSKKPSRVKGDGKPGRASPSKGIKNKRTPSPKKPLNGQNQTAKKWKSTSKGKKMAQRESSKSRTATSGAGGGKVAKSGTSRERSRSRKGAKKDSDERVPLADMVQSDEGTGTSRRGAKRKNSSVADAGATKQKSVFRGNESSASRGGRGRGGKGAGKGSAKKNAPGKRAANQADDGSSEDEDVAPVVGKGRGTPKSASQMLALWSNEESISSSSESSSSEEESEPAKWQVICDSVEDWEKLTVSFKKSKVECEKELYLVLSENFLPEINSLYMSKERELRRKLLEMAPKRLSSRIATNKSKQEEEDKLQAIRDYENERRRLAEEASRRTKKQMADERRVEENKKKSRAQLREERLNQRNNPSSKQRKKKLYDGFKKDDPHDDSTDLGSSFSDDGSSGSEWSEDSESDSES